MVRKPILENHQFVDSALWAQKSPKILAGPDKNARLASYFEPLVLQKGHFLFREGDLSDGLYFLQSGRVSVILELPNDRTKRLRTYQSGTILGEMGLYTHSPRSASIIADQISHLHFLSRQAFEKIQLEDPELTRSLHQVMVNLLTDRLKNRENELNALLK